ncbi:MAG TPA: cob(I)yrinic acid a,c-diamide adenosyltransferase [Tepidisphaeraceae bacterium]|jgi:cob(I)alamin adenosyltransferase|nr:cob(I)yrinic acid a,c-diamide adenosyltransferase [Tepidisphaeraceae bacterium]
MKIYTKTGDDGTTGLIGGTRVRKSDLRLDCYGTADELNAAVGLAIVIADASAVELAGMLREVQNDLFIAGSHLATPEDSPHRHSLPPLDEAMVSRLEMQIDAAVAKMPALRNFILPGGSELAARLHLARTICRRGERLLVDFAMNRPVAGVLLTYFNRLSDWLFTQARRANQLGGIEDIPWKIVEGK